MTSTRPDIGPWNAGVEQHSTPASLLKRSLEGFASSAKSAKQPPANAAARQICSVRHYEDTVVDRFVEKAAKNGMDVFRVFDALNDIRNVRRSIQAVKRAGKHAQGTICYTVSPLHTIPAFVEFAEQLVDMGCDSICIKDMAALLKPQPAYEIVKAIKRACGDEMRVHVHVHATPASLRHLMKAVEPARLRR